MKQPRATSLIGFVLILIILFNSVTVGATVSLHQEEEQTRIDEQKGGCGTTVNQGLSHAEKHSLATTSAPILNFHSDEEYRPTSVKKFIQHATIDGENVSPSNIANMDGYLEISDPPADAHTEQKYGDELSNVVYAQVCQTQFQPSEFSPQRRYTAITNWMFYFYDPKSSEGVDWMLAHQSDFESVTILVNESGPQFIAGSQHFGAEYRRWGDVERYNTTHPQVYPARGSHANYFVNTDEIGTITETAEIEGQDYHAPEELEDSSFAYDEVTGDFYRWVPAEEANDDAFGKSYEIEVLTGDEDWQQFDGSFTDPSITKRVGMGILDILFDIEKIGQVPAERDRWKNPGQWMEDAVSYRSRAKIDLSWSNLPSFVPDWLVNGNMNESTLVVIPYIENEDPYPESFYATVIVRNRSSGTIVKTETTDKIDKQTGVVPTKSKIIIRSNETFPKQVNVTVQLYAGQPQSNTPPLNQSKRGITDVDGSVVTTISLISCNSTKS